MQTKTTTVIALMMSVFTFSQVGIDTETPQATLDVVGKPTNTSVLDGIIAPRMEGAQLRAKTYTSAQRGAWVYVTTADTTPAGQTLDVTKEGYYFFNGTKWIPSDGYNIYNANGALTSTRTLNLNGRELNITGTSQRSSWSTDGVLYQENRQGPGGSAAIAIAGGNSSNLWLQQFYNGDAQVQATYSATALKLSTHGTDVSAPVTIVTSSGGGAFGTEKMRVTGEGNIGINTTTPTEKLDVDGITRIRELPLNGSVNAIHTTPDGDLSTSQNQTFTATKTIVADDNGVLGYVTGLPAASQNIYNTSGSLTSNRNVTLSGRTLQFTGSAQSTHWATNGALWQNGTPRASIYLNANSDSRLNLQVDSSSTATISAAGNATSLSIMTNQTTVSAPITFSTSSGANANGTEKMRITGTGNVGIGTSNPTAKLHVVKLASDLTPAIIAGCNVYADNAAAVAAGLPVGGLYRKADGTLMVRY